MGMGGNGHDGDIWLMTSNGNTRVELEAHDGQIRAYNGAGAKTFQVNGKSATMTLGGGASDGEMFIKNNKNKSTIKLDGNKGAIKIMGKAIKTADFVFESDYQLPKLDQVSDFINANKHLPDVPSAQQMKTDGLDLNNFATTLLQKVEELTLYTLEQHQQIKDLQQEISELKK